MITADSVSYSPVASPLSFRLRANKCTIICSRREEYTTRILRKCADLDDLSAEESIIYADGIDPDSIASVCFFFNTGILLSNLSLIENISLPYRYHAKADTWTEYENRITSWVKFFHLDLDLTQRPAGINLTMQKIISYIRNLIIQPTIYIFDAPLFQLNYPYQKKIIDCLGLLKEGNNTMMVGTSDLDLIRRIADEVIIIDNGSYPIFLDMNSVQRQANLQVIEKYLDE
jgi:ABC-type multidrug transport system ATPase subunit